MDAMLPKWARDVSMDDLQNETIREMAELLGVDVAMQIVAAYSGAVIYIPKLDSVYRVVRDRKIKEAYNGSNTKRLAQEYGVTESWVRRLIGGRLDGQLDMFDFVDEKAAL